MAAILLYGGIGYLLGMWLGHRALFVAGGVLVGMALGLYLVHVKLQAQTKAMIGGDAGGSADSPGRES